MKFKDQLDIFCYKRDFDSIINSGGKINNDIKIYFEYVDNLIIDINKANENDGDYLLYNIYDDNILQNKIFFILNLIY